MNAVTPLVPRVIQLRFASSDGGERTSVTMTVERASNLIPDFDRTPGSGKLELKPSRPREARKPAGPPRLVRDDGSRDPRLDPPLDLGSRDLFEARGVRVDLLA